MSKGVLIIIVFLIACGSVFAVETQKPEDDSIPYIKLKYQSRGSAINLHDGQAMSMADREDVTQEIKKLSVQDIKKISSIGKKFCSNLGDADVKIWFAIGVKGEVAIVEASFQSGIEVTFHCKQDKS